MKKTIHIDVVVIGGGASGYSAAFRCADLGLSVCLIEKFGILGGTCLNVGCIPSKSLLYLSKVIKEVENLEKEKIFSFTKKKINIQKIQIWKNLIIEKLLKGLEHLSKQRNVLLIKGFAKFFDKNTVEIFDNSEYKYITFDYSIIASGSHASNISHFLPENKHVWNSTDALKLSCIPKNLLIIGAGIIGLEMATIYQALGSAVHIVDTSKTFMPNLDLDISNYLLKIFKKNISISLETTVSKVQYLKHGLEVTFNDSHGVSTKNFYDYVLVAVGRRPNIQNMNFSKLSLELNDFGFIKVDSQLRTNIPNIFAVGDVTGQPMLAHKGIYEAHIAAEVIIGQKHHFDPLVIPYVAYCDPEIAWVGINEKIALEKNIDFESVSIPWIFSGRAVSTNCSEHGITKIIYDKKTHKILGATILGRNAGELISQISISIEMGCEAEDLSLIIFPHPTLSESINLVSKLFLGCATDVLNKV
ncbi:dihydrolipoyl dehydrogenase [Buchnera aphidicola]|uniref:Dihydrolipoyl dehydrogenase n=1 Tax=Buchnera aphidicola subsp. Tuberolachnus salignus TaxID=98804 RepID=A0A170PBP3_BUCTT|nr:dihydrolipoyl dehydrogenase [Buchnera aphidicola]CUR53123.1 Dihydrolipoyl dehydrogenase [Buchnera aphidicola (Tuberolachnus salignus)]